MKKVSFLFTVTVIASVLNLANAQTATNTFPSTGNVGIGTTSPLGLLDLGNTTGFKFFGYGSGGNTGYVSGLGMDLGQSLNQTSVVIGGSNSANSGTATFAVVRGEGTYPYTGYSDLFVIDSRTARAQFNGNVGIGTANPFSQLHVNAGTDRNLLIRSAGVFSAGIDGIGIHSVNDANNLNMPIQLESSLLLLNAATGGKVGIGTTTPTARLQVAGPGTSYASDPSYAIHANGGTTAAKNLVLGYDETIDAGVIGAAQSGVAWKNIVLAGVGGNVGVGEAHPQTRLHVSGIGTSLNTGGNPYSGDMIIQADDGTRNATAGATLEFVIPANTDGTNLWGQGRITTVAGNLSSSDATGKMILGTRRYFNKTGAGNNWYYGDDMTIDGIGNIGIGTTTPAEKLSVNGNVRSKKIIVTQVGWPDYVFDSAYNLPSLAQVEQFIKSNKHLPGVTSADEVKKDGLDLGKNQSVLLKKLEELTLYMIEQGKKIDAIKKENDEIKRDNQEMKEQNRQLQLQVQQLGDHK